MTPAAGELQRVFDDYCVAVAGRYARESVRVHRSGLEYFGRFAQERGLQSVAEVTEAVLGDFHGWLMLLNLKPATVEMRMRSVKLFLRWACGQGLTLYDAQDYKLGPVQNTTPEPPTAEVMKRLLELPNRKTPEGLRDQLVLELLYGLGLRRAEACSLEIDHLNFAEETIFVVGKGGHQRLLPMGLTLKSAAQDYLFNGRPRLLPEPGHRALLICNEGRPLLTGKLWYIVKKYGEVLDLKLSPHILRHACATHLVERGMNLGDIGRLLGHQNIDSTKRYAQIRQEQMDREFRRAHPRASR